MLQDRFGDDRQHVVMLGTPGSGKGTQCARLAEMLGVMHVSTGAALRHEMRRGSMLGRRAADYVEAGMLVPDDLVVDAVSDALARQRDHSAVLLDGFPRTVAQAVQLDALRVGSVRLVLALVVPRAVLLRRLAGRGRADDGPAVAHRRLVSYEHDTGPVLAWYAERGLLDHVDGNRPPADVTVALVARMHAAGIVTARASA